MVPWLTLPMLPLQRVWVRSLVRELRSHMPFNVAKNKETGSTLAPLKKI